MAKSIQSKQNLLASARKKKGWSQAYIAEQVRVSTDTVRQWERGRHLPYQTTIQKLCDLFQMTPEELGLFNEQVSFTLFQAEGATTVPDGTEIVEGPTTQLEPIRGANADEQKAAWEIYIELVTRIATVPLDDGTGLLREALSSFHTLFHQVRTILRSHNPTLPFQDRNAYLFLCSVGVRMLNMTLRPLLAKWHPLLKDYEDQRPALVGTFTYEQQWEKSAELRQEIALARTALLDYATTFAQIAGVSSLIDSTPDNVCNEGSCGNEG